MSDALVVFTPSGKRGRFALGTPILTAARQLGVDIDSVCGGRAICGRCQVTVGEGAFAKHGISSAASHLSSFSATEQRYQERKSLQAGRRLSCQAMLQGDIVIDVPADSQVHKQVVRKRAEVRAIELDTLTRLYYVEVEEPDMHKQRGDFERVEEALRAQWGLGRMSIDLTPLRDLQKLLRKGGWKLTVAVHKGERIVAAWPAFHDTLYGIAIDVGSTTIAAHLCDLHTGEVLASSGMMNPQIRFGEDLMSRVSYAMMNPGGEVEMTAAVRTAVDELVRELCAEAKADPEDVLELVFVGNPIMHHLLLGIDPVELGGAPFALATDSAVELLARDLDISTVNAGARVYILPCIAGHVGADCAGVVLSETPYLNDEITLLVDVGTNAEIVLGNRDRLLACSSPTGPAFEGAQIGNGQRAAPGAIERVRLDKETLEPRFKVIGCDLWSNEPGFAEATSHTGVTGICGSGIIEALAEMYLAGLITTDGVVDGTLAPRSPRVRGTGRTFGYVLHTGEPEIVVSQNDIRAIQLAKAALYAGARLLMDRLGVETVGRVTLAGAFGSHIDPLHAMVLGMIPDCPLDKVGSAGNAAGTGARIALLNGKARAEIEAVVGRIEKVETAIEPRFQEHFVAAMAIPHKTASYPNLSTVVSLPLPRNPPEAGGRRRRRSG
ncbi:MAG: ASKHA domain-containing protein [Geminicoccaceae bacterium]